MISVFCIIYHSYSELSTLSHYLYNHEQQSLRFVEHPYNFNIANKTRAYLIISNSTGCLAHAPLTF